MDEMSLEEMLEKINFRSIEVKHCGSGWVGTRYVLHTYSYGSSGECESFKEIKEWILRNLKWQLH